MATQPGKWGQAQVFDSANDDCGALPLLEYTCLVCIQAVLEFLGNQWFAMFNAVPVIGTRQATAEVDWTLFTNTEVAAQRVYASVERLLRERLQLTVNHNKSCIRKADGLEYVGYEFRGYGGQIRVSKKKLDGFKKRVSEIGETPSADPHARCCGRGPQQCGSYPDCAYLALPIGFSTVQMASSPMG